VAGDYQNFQYKSLEYGIDKLNMKGVDVYKRTFVEIIISISYFRVPEFREKFLTIIMEKGDMEIPEWRSTEGWTLDMRNIQQEDWSNPAIAHMFDWNQYCYEYIPQEVSDANMEILQTILQSDRWKHRLQKRGVAYFLTIKHWATYVKNTLVSRHVNWKDVPGYRQIIKSILIEMKQREVIYYP